MSQDRKCPQCGAQVQPESKVDLCEECLLQAGLAALNPPHLQIRCPHCHNAVEVLDEVPFGEITCPSCDSRFSLVGESTVQYEPDALSSIEHFDLIHQLGVGSFGTVWKCRDTRLDRIVALKVPRKSQLTAEETEQFLREARAAAQLQHPNIVGIHEIGNADGQVYIVSDYVEGLNLADWISGGIPAMHDAVTLTATLAEALHHAHEAGVIHRDLKPSNVMVDSEGKPHLMDFGLAKREAGEITMTVQGKILGTPAYMSPEQARGESHSVDRRSDTYSLGVILFELLTGEKPFRGTVRMLLHQVIHEEAPSLRKLNGSVPRDLETICLKCMEKDPQKRYSSAKEVAEELRRFLRGQPILARPIPVVQRIWRGYQQHASFFAAAYTMFTFALMGLMPIVILLMSLVVRIPPTGDLVSSAAVLLFWLGFTWLGIRSGISAFRGDRRARWVCLWLFGAFVLIALFGLIWSLQALQQAVGLDHLFAVNPFDQEAGKLDPLIRNSVMGYAVLGVIWSVLGFALQINAMKSRGEQARGEKVA